MDYSDKSEEWFIDFEKKALSMVTYYTQLKETRKIISIAKRVILVRKQKIKLYGKDGANKSKLIQMKVLVKTMGAFVKPMKVEEILKYDGVMIL